ncbi:hypothetical protein ACFYE2_00460 [Kocuria sp. CPCC 205300]|uniref:hypothetical protein n=1 Tax=Kocuria sabuli TaxID=3071448 RepID=UPI0036DB9605
MEADLQRFYGIALADMWREEISVRRVAVLVENLPRGAESWVAHGGPMAVSEATEATYVLESTLNHVAWLFGGKNGPAPEMREYPPYAEGCDVQQEESLSKAERWRRREAERKRQAAQTTDQQEGPG